MTITLDAQAPTRPCSTACPGRCRSVRSRTSYRKANETALLLRELSRLGPIQATLDDSAVPALQFLDAEAAYLTWTVPRSRPTRATRRSAKSSNSSTATATWTSAGRRGPVAEVAGEPDATSPPRPEPSPPPRGRAASRRPRSKPGRSAGRRPAAPAEAAAPVAGPVAARRPPRRRSPPTASPAAKPAQIDVRGPGQPAIRVDLDRVDRLIDLVGELVINQAMLAQRVDRGRPRPRLRPSPSAWTSSSS